MMTISKTKKQKILGVIVGRFQPCHLGHENVIEEALDQNDEVVVFLGSAQYSRTYINPFTVEERIQMMKLVFPDAKEQNLRFVPINDIHAIEHVGWTNYLDYKLRSLSIIKDDEDVFITFYSGSDEEAAWYSGWADDVEIIDRFTNKITATDIRDSLMLGTDSWKKKVPAAIHEFISNSFPNEFRTKLVKNDNLED